MDFYKRRGGKKMDFHTIDEAVKDLKEGKLILVTDDPDREND